ncbi:cytidylyltransferase domain-containing protein [Elusimicrobiota bacterium]
MKAKVKKIPDKPVCIIPAKGRSGRLPAKNIKNLCGKPMLAYTIEAAVKSGVFKEVLVSTESKKIAQIAEKYGGCIPYLRPGKLTEDNASVVDVCLHMIEFLEKSGSYNKTLCVLLPTTPLRTATDIRNAYKLFVSKRSKFLMAITNFIYEPFEALAIDKNDCVKPYWGKDYTEIKRQKRPDLVVDNGAIYIVDIVAFKKEKTFYGNKLVSYPMTQEKSIDINTEFDFKIAEYFIKERKK